MTDRKRDPLPKGYQFGDARDPFSRLSDEQETAYCEALADAVWEDFWNSLPVFPDDLDWSTIKREPLA